MKDTIRHFRAVQAMSWLVGRSPVFLNAIDQLPTIAKSDAPVERERELARGVRTCALDAFLVHYRNLKQFLINQIQRFPLDVKGQHYSSSWVGTDNVVESYENEDTRLNRLLAHISYDREDLDRGDWDTAAMERNLRDSLERFLRDVDPAFSSYFDEVREVVTKRKPRSTSSVSSGNRTDTVSRLIYGFLSV